MVHYSKEEIERTFECVGIKKGDDVFLHTNLGFFGICEGVKSADELCQVFYSSLRRIIGDEGTIIVPTFTYSSCHKEPFDPRVTPCNMGMFSDYIWKLPETIRSVDPNFSIAAIGNRAKFYTENPPQKSFGDDCFFERFYANNGIICNLNFDAGTTFVHYVEHKLNVPYRYDKKFIGQVYVDCEWQERVSYHFVFDKPENAPCFDRLHDLVMKNGVA